MGVAKERKTGHTPWAELLAPAGSFESMEAAVRSGADAVYMGGPRFGARAYADNPQTDGVVRALDYVHMRGKKLYLTVNTLFKQQELTELYDYLLPFYEAGLDAVLVQDLGALLQIRRDFPELPVHASTQMTVMDADGALALAELGVSRIVTARELTLAQMRALADTGIELEVFVHGSICYCYSGQCLLSSLIGGRSGNRGRCAQPCRLPYDVSEEGRTLTKSGQNYVLNLKDMDTLSCLPQLLEAGAVSLKIEGRMKSPRYTGGVTAVYRKYLDLCMAGGEYRVEEADRRFLRELFDRGGYTEYASRGLRDGMVAVASKPEMRPVDEAFLREKEKELTTAASKEKIKGKVRFFINEPVIITMETTRGHISVTQSGPVVQAAKNRPFLESDLRERFLRLGDTPFEWEHLEIETAGEGFLPVGQLNELRRRAAAELETAVIRSCHREKPLRSPCADVDVIRRPHDSAGVLAGAVRQKGPVPNTDARETNAIPKIHVLVSSCRQMEILSEYPGIARVYLEVSALSQAEEEALLRRFRLARSWAGGPLPALYVALPPVLRGGMKEKLEARLDFYEQNGAEGYLVHTWDQAAWLRRRMPAAGLQADASLYTWNHPAVQTLAQLGVTGATLPFELNSRELEERTRGSVLPSELTAYGYLPAMVSAQCVRRTLAGCGKESGILYLKDRKHKRFAVRNHCRFCYNTVYNSEPLFLLDMQAQWRAFGLEALRLQFTIEKEEQMRAILDSCLADLPAGRPVSNPLAHFTRGHFRRGVE